jgi:hypothetical protein
MNIIQLYFNNKNNIKYIILYWFYIILNNTSAQTITLSYDSNGNRITKNRGSNIPLASISGDSVACIGNIIRLQANGGDTYQWIGGPSQQSYSKVINADDTFKVIATKGPGCKDTATQIVRGVPVPAVKPIIGDSMVSVNYIANYSILPTYGAKYVWTVNSGSILSGQNTNNILVKWNSTTGQGTINLTVLVNALCFTEMMTKVVNIGGMTNLTKLNVNKLSIYPNPSRDDIFVHLSLNKISPLRVNVVNMLGKTVFSQSIDNTSELNLPLNKCVFGSSGVYNLILQIENSTITEKIIITD